MTEQGCDIGWEKPGELKFRPAGKTITVRSLFELRREGICIHKNAVPLSWLPPDHIPAPEAELPWLTERKISIKSRKKERLVQKQKVPTDISS